MFSHCFLKSFSAVFPKSSENIPKHFGKKCHYFHQNTFSILFLKFLSMFWLKNFPDILCFPMLVQIRQSLQTMIILRILLVLNLRQAFCNTCDCVNGENNVVNTIGSFYFMTKSIQSKSLQDIYFVIFYPSKI